MKISSLTPAALAHRLQTQGLCLHTGAFVTHVQTDLQNVSEGIGLLYADFALAEDERFADFHIRLARPGGLRRWLKPQVEFKFDGTPTFKPLPLDQAFPMFEWGLNWCVSSHAHEYLMIHAAVVEKNGCAAILPAPPGSGKSTLCAALVGRGWRLLSDELALIRLTDGQLAALPRPISLKNASIEIIARFLPEAVLSRPVRDTMKGTVAHMKPPAASVARAAQTARPAWVIFPRYVASAATCLTPVTQAQAFMRVADNAFNYSLLGARGFSALAGVIDASSCHDFSYSVLDEALAAFDALALAAA